MPRSRVAFLASAVLSLLALGVRSQAEEPTQYVIGGAAELPSITIPALHPGVGQRPAVQVNAPASGANENIAMGVPSAAGTSPNDFLMMKPQYVLSYNDSTHNPNWVSWHLNSTWLGSADRANDFRADPDLPSQFQAVKPSDYHNSGFDEGHMCNSKDRTNTEENNQATFLMTNMVPQSPKDNEQTWKGLEDQSRKWALDSSQPELFIVSGPAGKGGEGRHGAMESLPMKRGHNVVGQITVPKCVWKVILIVPHGTSAGSQVGSAAKMVAVIMPNNQELDGHWAKYQVSVSQVEQLTHYQFFSGMNPSVASALKAQNASSSPVSCN